MTLWTRRLTAALAAALLGPAAAGENPAVDFRKPGPFPVGVRTLILVDPARDDPFTGGKRTLVTDVWYPAAAEAAGRPRTRFAEFFGRYRQEAEKALKQNLDAIEENFRTLAVRDAPLRPGKYPFLVFSHGNGGFRHQNVFQMDHLASHGYIVAAPDHTGNASLAPLPDRPAGYDRGGRQRSAEERPVDVSFLIDWFLQENGKEGSPWNGAVSPEQIGVLGHSFGGYTSCAAAAHDRRIKAIVPMTVAFAGLENGPAAVPCLIFLGKHDRTMRETGNFVARGYFIASPAEKFLLTLKRGGHFTFTEMSVLDPNFGDGIGHGKGLDGKEMDFIPAPLAKEIINAYTLAFFDAFLRGGEEARKFLDENHYPEELELLRGSDLPAAAQPARRERF